MVYSQITEEYSDSANLLTTLCTAKIYLPAYLKRLFTFIVPYIHFYNTFTMFLYIIIVNLYVLPIGVINK